MKIKIKTEFLDEMNEKEIEVIIKAKQPNESLDNIIEGIQNISNDTTIIIAEKDNKVYILDIEEIIKIYSNEQYTYCIYNNEAYRVKKKLYELEELLKNKNFLRISNSCIVNIKKVECFDMGKIGSIIVKLKNNDIENVSKRRISEVTKYLKERWN